MVYYGRSSEGNKIYGLFGHFSVRGEIVATGDIVNRGEIIGFSGNTGYSTGPHLHYSIMEMPIGVNPVTKMNNRVYVNYEYYVNPSSYMYKGITDRRLAE